MTLAAAAAVSWSAHAYDFAEGGLYYNIIEDDSLIASVIGYAPDYADPEAPRFVEVTYDAERHLNLEGSYSGEVAIPTFFTHDGINYWVIAIGDEAFRYSDGLTSVTFPTNSFGIRSKAFADCTGLQLGSNGSIPAKWIEDEAFAGSGLESVMVNCRMGSYVFSGCKALYFASVYSDYVPEGAFADCPSLSHVNLRCSSIGKRAFLNCTALPVISINNGATSIYEEAFKGCTNLRTVELEEDLRYVGDGVFADCTSLEKVEIKGTQTSGARNLCFATQDGADAFRNCPALKEIIIGRPIVDDDDKPFNPFAGYSIEKVTFSGFGLVFPMNGQDFPDLTTIVAKTYIPPVIGTFSAVQYRNINVTVPEPFFSDYRAADVWKNFNKVEKSPVESFWGVVKVDDVYYDVAGQSADVTRNPFGKYSGEITVKPSVRVADSEFMVWRISEDAFYECDGLQSVSLPDSIYMIENYAFARSGIRKIDLSGMRSSCHLGEYVFSGCTHLEEAVLPSDLEEIPDGMFDECSSLKGIALPATLRSIGGAAFYQCGGLEKIDMSECRLEKIGNNAFYECSLSEVSFPADSRRRELLIGDGVFRGNCLTNLTISTSIERIGSGVFDDNPLSKVEIPYTSGTLLAEGTIFGESSIDSLIVDRRIDPLSSYDHETDEVIYQNGIGYGTIDYVELGENLSGDRAVWLCGKLDVKAIRSKALRAPSIRAFSDEQYSTISVTVPAERLEHYKEASVWKEFLNLKAYDPAAVNAVDADRTVTVSAADGLIRVSGPASGAMLEVCDISGMTVYRHTHDADECVIPVAQGVYIVNVSGLITKKVVVK